MKEAGEARSGYAENDPRDPNHLLHQRLLAGDRGRLEVLFNRFSFALVRRLGARPRFRRVDPQRIEDAVLDALVEYNARPTRFDPARGRPLEDYLALAAGRDLLNLIRSETRRHRHEERAARDHAEREKSVELSSPAGNALKEEEAERLRALRRRGLELLSDPLDRQVFERQLSGERRTGAFAAVLGIAHLPADEQRRRVKRVKDRIDKVLRRGAGHE